MESHSSTINNIIIVALFVLAVTSQDELMLDFSPRILIVSSTLSTLILEFLPVNKSAKINK